jgi:hypothetical protein
VTLMIGLVLQKRHTNDGVRLTSFCFNGANGPGRVLCANSAGVNQTTFWRDAAAKMADNTAANSRTPKATSVICSAVRRRLAKGKAGVNGVGWDSVLTPNVNAAAVFRARIPAPESCAKRRQSRLSNESG